MEEKFKTASEKNEQCTSGGETQGGNGGEKLSIGGPECRICFTGTSVKADRLIRPCNCSGSLMYAHYSCMDTWLRESGRNTCEICNAKFQYERRFKKLSEWSWCPCAKHQIGALAILLFIFAFVVFVNQEIWSNYWKYRSIILSYPEKMDKLEKDLKVARDQFYKAQETKNELLGHALYNQTELEAIFESQEETTNIRSAMDQEAKTMKSAKEQKETEFAFGVLFAICVGAGCTNLMCVALGGIKAFFEKNIETRLKSPWDDEVKSESSDTSSRTEE